MGKLSAAHAHRLLTHNVIPRTYLATVVEHILRSAAASGGEKRLRRLIRRQVQIPGYDDPWQAPGEELLHATLEAVEVSAPVWRAVLRAWARGEGALAALATSYLEERFGPAGAPPEGWTPDGLRDAVDAVRTAMPGAAHNDVALMLCWLTGYVPLPEEEAAPAPDGDLPNPRSTPGERLPARRGLRAAGVEHWQILFREVLEGLRQVAADSAVWEAVARFIDDLRGLVEEKRSERDAARDRLRRALDALRAEAEVDLGYFALTDIPLWRAERAPLDRIADLALIADNLRQHLRRHRRLRAATPDTLSEGAVQRMRLHTLESAVLAAHARLAEELGGGSASEEPGPPVEAPAPPGPEPTPVQATEPAPERPAVPGPQPEAGTPGAPPSPPPPHEEGPPGPEPTLEIVVEEEEPAPAPAAAKGAAEAPPQEAVREALPEPPLVAPQEPACAEEPAPREEPPAPPPEPPTVPAPKAPAEEAPDLPPVPEAPPVEPAAPSEAHDEGVPVPPAVPPAPSATEATTNARPPDAASDGAGEAPAPPSPPPEGEGGFLSPLRVAAQPGGAGSWFADLAHWEPLARDAHARRPLAANGAARPPRGLRGAFDRARRVIARLLRRVR